jgi:hypothetical protein
VGLLAVRLVIIAIQAAVTPSHGFMAYYTAARLVLEGAPVSRFYDDDWFREQTTRIEARTSDIYNVNPPVTALLMLPLAGLSHAAARAAWTVVNLGLLAWAVTGLVRSLSLDGGWRLVAWGAVLAFEPVIANIRLGQVYGLLLCLLVLAWMGWQRARPAWLAAGLGGMMALKTAGLWLWPLLIVRRQWRALAGGLVVAGAVAAASLPLTGPDAWRVYGELLTRFSARPELTVAAYQSGFSLLRRLFTHHAHALWNPAPLVNAPAVGALLPWLVLAAVLGMSAYAAHKSAEQGLAFGSFAIAAVALSPVALDYHYVLMLAPLGIVLSWARRQPAAWVWGVLVLSVLAMGLELPYRSPRLESGIWALLAYPKLYGAAMLWGLTLWGCLASRSASVR